MIKAFISIVAASTLVACSQQTPATPASPLKAQPAEPPSKTILGITLSEPMNFPECETQGSGRSIRYVFAPKNLPCWKDGFIQLGLSKPKLDNPNREESIQVLAAPNDVPSGISDTFNVRLIDGKVEEIRVDTLGTDRQDYIYRLLTEKWHKPTYSSVEGLQNGLGAQVEGIRATWKFPDFSLHYYGILTANTGAILVQSRIMEKMEEEKQPKGADSF